MGGGKGRQDQPTLSQVPDSTCKVEDRISKLQLIFTSCFKINMVTLQSTRADGNYLNNKIYLSVHKSLAE